MTTYRILIAGIGNIFLGDDAFGVEVARRLAEQPLPPEVLVRDFGIRGLDLAYALLDGYAAVVLVDAAPRGAAPGTLYVIEPEVDAADEDEAAALLMGTHDLSPERVLRLVSVLGGKINRLLLVGCEPSGAGIDPHGAMEMSPPVRAAVEQALPLIHALVTDLLADERQPALR